MGGGARIGADKRQKICGGHAKKRQNQHIVRIERKRKGVAMMPHGGARKGAGRKPKPLAEKLAAGNPGHRPLKKVEFAGNGNDIGPPEYLGLLEKKATGMPTPIALYHETIRYLQPSDCLNLIPAALISDYVMAKYYLLCAQFDLSKTAIVAKNDKNDWAVTGFTDAVLKLQKNVLACWEPIWDIVSRNSERLVTNPEQDLMAILLGSRQRKKTKGAPDDFFEHPQNPGGAAESGPV
jgi:hypothetical protein